MDTDGVYPDHLTNTDVTCPLFEAYVGRLVAYVRENPTVSSDATA